MADFNLNVKAVEKLLDYTASGVGAIAGPILAPWRASREGKARLIAARADADIRRIEAESEAETSPIIAQARSQARLYLMSPDADVRGTVEVTRRDIVQRVEYQERKRLANVRSVVEEAADELGDKEVPDHEPDPDWTARFFNEVQDVSSEDMQKIWAKILAGEVESPGRTSLRTLDTLRDMTKKDAKMFTDICDFVVRNDFVFYDNSMEGFEALNYSNLLHLQDCGLINVGPNLIKKFRWGENKQIVLMYHGGALLVTGNSDNDGTSAHTGYFAHNCGEGTISVRPMRVAYGISASLLKFSQLKGWHTSLGTRERPRLIPIRADSTVFSLTEPSGFRPSPE